MSWWEFRGFFFGGGGFCKGLHLQDLKILRIDGVKIAYLK